MKIRGIVAVVGKFDASQRAVFVYGFGYQLLGGDIVIAPDAAFEERGKVTGVVNFGLFGADHAPTAFGFHSTHGGHAFGHPPAESVAVRHLIEAIRCGDRTDLDGLEENVVA